MKFEPKDILAIITVSSCLILKGIGINSTVDTVLVMIVSSYYTYEYAKKRLNE